LDAGRRRRPRAGQRLRGGVQRRRVDAGGGTGLRCVRQLGLLVAKRGLAGGQPSARTLASPRQPRAPRTLAGGEPFHAHARRGPAAPWGPGAAAVGLHGPALHSDPPEGWAVTPLPPRASNLNLTSVAFSGPSTAVAVGGFGVILRWSGTTWTEDPQSISLTQNL